VINYAGYGLYSKRVFTADGVKEAVVIIKEGKISDIIPPELAHPAFQVEDLHDLCLMPGLIDSHVHVNEPGRTDWEGFRTATRAAAAGGITTIADMPLNCNPVTTTVKALKTKLDVLKGILPAIEKKKSVRGKMAEADCEEKLWVDCAFMEA